MAKASRVTTAIRFEPDLHEAVRETAEELGVGINWLVNRLVREGLDAMDLSSLKVTNRGRLQMTKDTDRA